METPVILSACRTPIGKFGGALARWTGPRLGAHAVREAVSRGRVDGHAIDEVIMGTVLAAGLGQAPARQAALGAGLPGEVAAVTINKMCGSGLKAVMMGAQAIRCGDAQLVIAGGMESMSQAPYVLPRSGGKLGNRTLFDSMMQDGLTCSFSGKSMGTIANQVAADDQLSRDEQDALAARSHQRAVEATSSGAFAEELVPVPADGRSPGLETDEGPRPGTTTESLAKLPLAFETDGTVTAGNASMISDGAAALALASETKAAELGREPLARIVSYATAGGPPEALFTAPVAAIRRALERCGKSPGDIDLYEINEAFAAQMLACINRLELSIDRVNVNGGAIAIGHPIGASGARVLTTLLYALKARGQRWGVAALCLGGGNAVAMVVEAA